MIAPVRHAGPAAAVVERRAEPYADARRARDPRETADQHDGAEHAAEQAEARCEVGDGDAAATSVVETGNEDRRVREVLLLAPDAVHELHREETEILRALRGLEERAEQGIAVEAGKARPGDRALRIHEGTDPAVPD